MVRYIAVLVSISASKNPINFAALVQLPDSSLSPQQVELLRLIAGYHYDITQIYSLIWQAIFRTEGSYIGMGPYSLSVGDIAVLL